MAASYDFEAAKSPRAAYHEHDALPFGRALSGGGGGEEEDLFWGSGHGRMDDAAVMAVADAARTADRDALAAAEGGGGAAEVRCSAVGSRLEL